MTCAAHVVCTPAKQTENKASCCRDKKRSSLLQILSAHNARRAKVYLDRAIGRRTKGKTHRFPQQMCRARNFLEARGVGHRYIPQRIKKFDGHLQFLVEKLLDVWRARHTAGKKNASRWIATLLGAIMADRAH